MLIDLSHSVLAPHFSAGGIEPPTKFFLKSGDLTRSQLLEGVVEKEGVTFFQGRLQFLYKNIN